jgi:hypothetical protein
MLDYFWAGLSGAGLSGAGLSGRRGDNFKTQRINDEPLVSGRVVLYKN